MTKPLYPCQRCEGTGTIRAFAHVMGGVCFKCAGRGTVATKPRASNPKFAVFGMSRESGAPFLAYYVTAPNAARAVAKARATYARASAAYRDDVSLANAVAVRADELDCTDGQVPQAPAWARDTLRTG
ncbi:MAG: hypothetical protein ACOYB0_08275 [Polynucleobacter sp.]